MFKSSILLILAILSTSVLTLVHDQLFTDTTASFYATESCSFPPRPVPLPNPLPQEIMDALNEVDNLIQQNMALANYPGIYYSIIYRDQVLLERGYGYSDIAKGTVPTRDSVWYIGSVTKLLPAMMMYMMRDNQVITSTDDPIVKYAPLFEPLNRFSSEPITFMQMATQLSGIQREAPCVLDCLSVTTDEILRRLQSIPMLTAPYKKPAYSNLGFSLLGRILADLTPYSFEDYCVDKIGNPLGLTQFGFNLTSQMMHNLAVGYLPGNQPAPRTDFGWSAPCGGAVASSADLVKWAQFFFTDFSDPASPIMSTTSLQEMLAVRYINPSGTSGFGSPWELHFQKGYTVRNKGGNIAGYSTLLSVVPEIKLGFTLNVNAALDELSLSRQVYDILLPAFDSALKKLQPQYQLPSNTSDYLGTYKAQTGTTVQIEEMNGQLYLSQVVHNNTIYIAALEWITGEQLQLHFTNDYIAMKSCLEPELIALDNSYLDFATQNQYRYFTWFGNFVGWYFVRQ